MYTRISNLDSHEHMFSADIYYHQKWFAQYLQNYQLLKATPESKTKQGSTKRTVFSKYYEIIKDVLARGNGVSLPEIRDLKNQSPFMFSSSVDIKDVINVLCSIDTIKSAANIL